MAKFSDFLIKYRYIFLIVMVLLIALSVIGFMNVDVNSDITSYLDDDTMTKLGKNELESKFGIIGDMTIGIKGVEKEEVAQFVDDLWAKNHKVTHNGVEKDLINKVVWLGTFDDMLTVINDPEENAQVRNEIVNSYEVVSGKYYKEEEDVYIIAVYLSLTGADENCIKLIDTLEDELDADMAVGGKFEGGEYFMGGMAVNARALLKSSIGEIPKYLAVAVAFILLVLFFTTRSWLEPFIFLITLGVSIILNLGSNIILGTVSSITYSATAILQLALAMDYSIFLMHSYYEEKEKTIDPKIAMRRAMPKTLKAISASALTTVGGFVALFVMQFNMGFDLGAVLAKGVFLSLLSVIILQPILMFIFDKQIVRTSHKFVEPRLKKVGNLSIKFSKVIIPVAIMLLIPCAYFQLKVPLNYITMTETNPNPTVTEQVINQCNNQLIVIVPYSRGTINKQYEFTKQLEEIEVNYTNGDEGSYKLDVFSLSTILSKELYSGAVITNNPLLDKLESNLVSQGYILYTIELGGATEDKSTYDAIDQITKIAKANFGDSIYITGLGQGASDLAAVTPRDFAMVSLLSAAIILLIIILTFRKILLPIVLLIAIELGIFINLTLVTISGEAINFMSYIIISSIQLGATVDYAILFTSKFLQVKNKMPLKDAINDALRRSSPSIIVSATVLVIACISVYVVTSNVIVAQITMLIARGALLSTVIVMLLLPAVFYEMYKKKYTYTLEPVGEDDCNMESNDIACDDGKICDAKASDDEVVSESKRDENIQTTSSTFQEVEKVNVEQVSNGDLEVSDNSEK